MKPPVMQNRIFKDLKQMIVSGRYHTGYRLPTEPELAEQFGVARNTLRQALKGLEDEGLLERLPRQGTFVRELPMMAPQITFLLPCADFLTWPSTKHDNFRKIFAGVMKAAYECGLHVKTVPVSPTNDNRDIDWRRLNFINQGTYLILTGLWYQPVFEFIRKRRARTVLLYERDYQRPNIFAPHIEDFYTLCRDFRCGMEGLTRHLHSCGYRKIALAGKNIFLPNHPAPGGYQDVMRSLGLCNDLIFDIVAADNCGKLREIIHTLHDKHGFEAVILNGIGDILNGRDQLDLSFVQAAALTIESTTAEDMKPAADSFGFNYHDIGYNAVMRLLDNNFHAGEEIIPPVFNYRSIKK